MPELDPGGVQEHPSESGAWQRLVERKIAVFFVPRDGETDVGELHPDLMRAPGQQLRLEERVTRQARHPPEQGLRYKPRIADADASLAGWRHVLRQRELHVLAILDPSAAHQYQIDLFHL